MAIKFLSKEYEKELHDRLAEEFNKPSKLTCSFCQMIVNCPDGIDRWMLYSVDGGIMTGFSLGDGEAPAAQYRVRGPYEVYVNLIKGKLDGKTSLITKKLQLEGSMAKALGLIGAYTRIEKIQRSIETDFAL